MTRKMTTKQVKVLNAMGRASNYNGLLEAALEMEHGMVTRGLIIRGLIEWYKTEWTDNRGTPIKMLRITDAGRDWLEAN